MSTRAWLDGALSGGATMGFAWIVTLAFVRLSSKAGLFPSSLSVDEAIDCVDAWLAQPSAVIVEPGNRHLGLVRGLLNSVGVGGNLINDAHLAALAIEHRSEVVSYDNDFARFDGVVWKTRGPRR